MKGARKPLTPSGAGRKAFGVSSQGGGSVRTEPQEIPSCLAMSQLLKLSLNVIPAYWD